jgi:LPXTG-motif cell wall-anchored protein
MKKFHRAAALTAAALVGLTGLAGLSSPASATGADCVSAADAKYVHSFNGPAGTASVEITNGPLCEGQEQAFSLVSYTAPSAIFALPQYVLESSTDKFTAPTGAEKLTRSKLDFKVEVPECFTQVDFVFGDRIINPLESKDDLYNDRKVGSDKGEGSKSTPAKDQPKYAWYNGGSGTCVAEPAVEALSDCDGNVTLKLINRSTASAPFVITADNGFSKTETLAVRQEPVSVKVPAADAKNIKVTSRNKVIHEGGWTKPADCKAPEAGKPEGTVTSDCKGLTFTVKNPENGVPVTATFTPNKGEAKTVTVKPGTTEKVSFEGTQGLKVAVSGGLDVLNGEAVWTKPKDCGTPSTPVTTEPEETPSETTSTSTSPVATTPAAGDGGDPELPLTGSAAAGVAGGAFLLLVAGAVLFILARRRKVNFTA